MDNVPNNYTCYVMYEELGRSLIRFYIQCDPHATPLQVYLLNNLLYNKKTGFENFNENIELSFYSQQVSVPIVRSMWKKLIAEHCPHDSLNRVKVPEDEFFKIIRILKNNFKDKYSLRVSTTTIHRIEQLHLINVVNPRAVLDSDAPIRETELLVPNRQMSLIRANEPVAQNIDSNKRNNLSLSENICPCDSNVLNDKYFSLKNKNLQQLNAPMISSADRNSNVISDYNIKKNEVLDRSQNNFVMKPVISTDEPFLRAMENLQSFKSTKSSKAVGFGGYGSLVNPNLNRSFNLSNSRSNGEMNHNAIRLTDVTSIDCDENSNLFFAEGNSLNINRNDERTAAFYAAHQLIPRQIRLAKPATTGNEATDNDRIPYECNTNLGANSFANQVFGNTATLRPNVVPFQSTFNLNPYNSYRAVPLEINEINNGIPPHCSYAASNNGKTENFNLNEMPVFPFGLNEVSNGSTPDVPVDWWYRQATNATMKSSNQADAVPDTTREQILLQLFPSDAFYFLVKPVEIKNVIIGMQQCAWNFSPQTEKKIFKLFERGQCVILIFAPRSSNEFHGVAKLMSTNSGIPNHPCKIKWLTQNVLHYNEVKAFIHPRLHISEDGQQFLNSVGQKLCICIYDKTAPDKLFSRAVRGRSTKAFY